jgi:hypothetical protein
MKSRIAHPVAFFAFAENTTSRSWQMEGTKTTETKLNPRCLYVIGLMALSAVEPELSAGTGFTAGPGMSGRGNSLPAGLPGSPVGRSARRVNLRSASIVVADVGGRTTQWG